MSEPESISPEPTRFPELNRVLVQLVRGTEERLGGNLTSVYLRGSFALGEADEHSDVDFLVLTKTEVTAEQERALQEMHADLYKLENPWAQRLEGSYAPKDRFRQVDVERTPFLFLDNGASQLARDSHCNTALVRWILRERGITLFGPPPQETIDPAWAQPVVATVGC